MRTAIFVFVCALSYHPQSAWGQDVAAGFWPLPDEATFGEPASPSDAAAIVDLLASYDLAWGSEDVEGLIDLYSADAEWTNAYGVVLRGHDALREFLTEMFERFDAAMASTEAENKTYLSTRHLSGTVAVVHAVTESGRTPNRDGAGLRRIHVTYVVEKLGSDWKIAHQMIMDARL